MSKILPKQPGAERVNKGRTWADYKALAFEAQVLYVKHGFSAHQVAEKLGISIQTVSKWNKAGRWQELRPDLEIMKQCKAADLYLKKGMTLAEIAMRLNEPEYVLMVWADFLGWNATKMVTETASHVQAILDAFCECLLLYIPKDGSVIELAKTKYLKTFEPKL